MRTYSRMVRRARELRRRLSPPEARLWLRLRTCRTAGLAFRRQHPLGNMVLDFYCARARLCIEVDGWTHDQDDQAAADLRRDAALNAQGILTVRIPARALYDDPDAVADDLWRLAAERAALPPAPPPPRRSADAPRRGPPPPLRG